jgi:hypothetical protein
MVQLGKATIHGQAASVLGIAISDQEVYDWAKMYYYGGSNVEPTDFGSRAPAQSGAKKGESKAKTGDAGKEEKPEPATGKKDGALAKSTPTEVAQMPLLGNTA